MTHDLIIFGDGEIAEVAYYYFTHDSEYNVVAFTVDASYIKKNELFNLPVLPFEEINQYYPSNEYAMHVSMGNAKRNSIREKKYIEAKEKGYRLVSYISSEIHLWPDHDIGDNCFILEDNTIQPFTKIGCDVVMWSGNHLGHHSNIGDHSFITSHTVISGGVHVGKNSFIGVNATIRDHVSIGAHSIIGAGALILSDTAERSVYPATETTLSLKK